MISSMPEAAQQKGLELKFESRQQVSKLELLALHWWLPSSPPLVISSSGRQEVTGGNRWSALHHLDMTSLFS